MASVISFLVDQFYHNPFMTAALVAAPVTLLTYSARAVPGSLWATAKRVGTMELRFNSDMDDYEQVQNFLMGRVVSQRWSRTFKYHSRREWLPGDEKPTSVSGLSIGYGAHLGWWEGWPVWVDRQLTEGNQTEKFKESLQITFAGRDLARVRRLVTAVEQHVLTQGAEQRVNLFVNAQQSWERMPSVPRRSIGTVLTNDNQGEAAVEHVRQFEASKTWFAQRGLPHHTGIILQGSPGTGKSSLIQAVAAETNRSIYYLNLGAVTEERQLTSLLACRRRWDDVILVIEDIDASGAVLNRGDKGVVTLSTLLNILDGILSPDGIVFMASTNHPEALDPALMRPGRFDLALQMEALQWPQFLAMGRLFQAPSGVLEAMEQVYTPVTGASLRAKMLRADWEGLRTLFATYSGPS